MCLVGEGGRKRILLSISLTSPDNTCFVVDQDLSISGMGDFFLNSLHGLMCFTVRKNACIYNPSTGQCLTLTAIKPDIIAEQGQWQHDNKYSIGYDSVSGQHKLFCTIAISTNYVSNLKSEHWVFVLEAGGSWKKIVPLESYHPHAPFALGQSISGSVVHYIAWLDMYTCEIVSFDITSEELTTILVPEDVISCVAIPRTQHSHLKVRGVATLWVLEDVKKKEWSDQTLNLQPLSNAFSPRR